MDFPTLFMAIGASYIGYLAGWWLWAWFEKFLKKVFNNKF